MGPNTQQGRGWGWGYTVVFVPIIADSVDFTPGEIAVCYEVYGKSQKIFQPDQ